MQKNVFFFDNRFLTNTNYKKASIPFIVKVKVLELQTLVADSEEAGKEGTAEKFEAVSPRNVRLKDLGDGGFAGGVGMGDGENNSPSQ